MFIFSCDATLWIMPGGASGCGIFTCGSNEYRIPHGTPHDYAEYVGSRTIIGYILPLLD